MKNTNDREDYGNPAVKNRTKNRSIETFEIEDDNLPTNIILPNSSHRFSQ